MEIIIKNGGDMNDPRKRVLAIEAVTRSICEQADEDAANGVMMLLTAAAHIAMKHSRNSSAVPILLAEVLVHAIKAAEGFFTLRKT